MIDNIKKQIINRVKAKNLTLAKLEAQIGVPKGTVTSIINGRSTNPGIRLIKLIADGLDCPVGAIVQDYFEYNNQKAINYDLLMKCFNSIVEIINKQGYKCDINNFIHLLNESYKFLITKNSGVFDSKFIEWIIEKTLESSHKQNSNKIYIKSKNF